MRGRRARKKALKEDNQKVIELSTALDWQEFNNKDAYLIFCSLSRQQIVNNGGDDGEKIFSAINLGAAFVAFQDWLKTFELSEESPLVDPFEKKQEEPDPEQESFQD